MILYLSRKKNSEDYILEQPKASKSLLSDKHNNDFPRIGG